MKHTKGKWVVNPSWNYRKGISAKENTKNKPDGYTVYANIERKTLGGQDSPYSIDIARMQTYSDGNRPMDEVEANANLIASAPEMLTFLKEIVHNDKRWRAMNPKNNQGRYDIKLIDKVNYLIRKAEGGK